MNENIITIFTDASVSPQAAVSIGAYLIVTEAQLDKYASLSIEMLTVELLDVIVFEKFASNKSTWSEIKTAVNALNTIKNSCEQNCKIQLYTDCQSLCDLLEKRKEKLIKNKFITKAGKALQNAALYQDLFHIADEYQIMLFKIKGHHPMALRQTVHEKIFAVLDKLCRKKLRSVLSAV